MSIKSLNRDEANQIFYFLEQQEIHEREKLKKYGKVKSIIHTNHKDLKFVAVDNVLHYSKTWKTFHDFLFELVFRTFGKEWCENENLKNYDEQHEVFKWYIKSKEFARIKYPIKKV